MATLKPQQQEEWLDYWTAYRTLLSFGQFEN